MTTCPICDYEITDGTIGCPRHSASQKEAEKQSELPDTAGLLGKTLGKTYAVKSVIGKGAMGTVYRVTNLKDGRDLAMKVLTTQVATDKESSKRFHEETMAASTLRHPHIVHIHDFGILADGQAFIAMELLRGQTLQQLLKQRKYLSTRDALEIIIPVCEALAEAHSHGVLHRDMKPGNIMLCQRFSFENFVVVLDFGIAKVIQKVSDAESSRAESLIFGSPSYMSPERFMGQGGDFRSDIYSMGVIIFQMLSGRAPFRSSDLYQLMYQHINTPAPRVLDIRPESDVPEQLEETIARALSKQPEDRQQNMRKFLTEIQEIYKQLPVPLVRTAITSVDDLPPFVAHNPAEPQENGLAFANDNQLESTSPQGYAISQSEESMAYSDALKVKQGPISLIESNSPKPTSRSEASTTHSRLLAAKSGANEDNAQSLADPGMSRSSSMRGLRNADSGKRLPIEIMAVVVLAIIGAIIVLMNSSSNPGKSQSPDKTQSPLKTIKHPTANR